MSAPPVPVGRIARSLFALAAPIALAQSLLVGIDLVDTAIVGHAETPVFAGATLGRSIQYGWMNLAFGIAAAVEPSVSQAVGLGDRNAAWASLKLAIRLVALTAMPITLLSLATVWFAARIGAPADVTRHASEYVVGAALVPLCFPLFSVGQAFLQAQGHTRPVLIATCAGLITHAPISLTLVHGSAFLELVGLPIPAFGGLGAVGAGLATMCSSSVLFLTLVPSIVSRRAPAAEHVRWRPFTRMAAAFGLSMLAELGFLSALAVLCAELGATVEGAHQIVVGATTFAYMPAAGLGAAAAARVGRAIGAGEPVRATGLTAIAAGFIVMLPASFAFFFGGRAIASSFSPDPAVVALATAAFATAALLQLFDGIKAAAFGALRGMGDARGPLVIALVASWGLGAPIAFALTRTTRDLHGIWIALTCASAFSATVLSWRFLRRSSLEQRVIPSLRPPADPDAVDPLAIAVLRPPPLPSIPFPSDNKEY